MMTPRTFPVVAIDGGAGTGKTTSAARVAENLGYSYVDSGAVYRAAALALQRGGISGPEDARLPSVLEGLPLRIQPDPGRFRVFLDEHELGEEIRTPEISRLASRFAVLADVRSKVTALLRAASHLGPMVVEGRDIGTVVFPQATLKVFLHADLSVRARRRRGDLSRQGVAQSEAEVAHELAERDERDTGRAEAPLRRAEGALVVDTSGITIEEQVQVILDAFHKAQSGASENKG